MKRILLLGLLAGLLTTSTGCGLFQAVFCCRSDRMGGCGCGCGGCMGDECDGGCGPSCDSTCGATCGAGRRPLRDAMCRARVGRPTVVSDCDTCGDECGATCGPTCGRLRNRPFRTCGVGCDSCDSCGSYSPRDPYYRGCHECGDACNSCGGGRCWNRGPFTWVFALFSPSTWGCSGCGERYWGDFYSDPPDWHDPCDCYGNYAGGGCGCGGGGSYGEVRGGNGGCRHCGGHAARGDSYGGYDDGYASGEQVVSDRVVSDPQGGRVISQGDRAVNAEVGPAPQPHRAYRGQ